MALAITADQDWPRKRRAALAVAVWVLLASSWIAHLLNTNLNLIPGPDEYNVVAWEVRNFSGKWLYSVGSLFRDDLTTEQQDGLIRQYLSLTRDIETLELELSDAALRELPVYAKESARLKELRAERDRIENDVEAAVESRISAVARDEGITRSLLGLTDIVWPPVDFELTQSPRSLATSPRDRIALESTTILREDLELADVERIEDAKLREDNEAALAFPTGGIGAYPTIVDDTTSYRRLLEVVAHEWLHNYLVFRPLGFNYYASFDLRSINETVADLVGRELAAIAIERWPVGDPSAATPSSGRPQDTDFDVGAELRKLRGEVDGLLAAGKIEEAEALMEQRRRELVAQGAQIRKLNQAYFAFTNLYAGESGSPAATNPIGPKIDELRRRSASLREFVDIVGGVTSVAELDQLLAERP
jgi:hypothetical protein